MINEVRARECALEVFTQCFAQDDAANWLKAADPIIAQAIREAVEQEREACAMAVTVRYGVGAWPKDPMKAQIEYVAAIRARGQVTIGRMP